MTGQFTILGAGVAGLCVASELVSRKAAVAIIDPNPEPGPHGCSWWAGGMLAPFCEGETAEEQVVRLGMKAARWWENAGIDVTWKGSVVIALGRDRKELDRFARLTAGHTTLDRQELAKLEPDLGERFDRALFMQDEAHINPRLALHRLREKLLAKGVSISREGKPKGGIIDCRGLAAQDSLPDLRGVKGEMVILQTGDISLQRPVRLLHPRFPLYIVPRGDGVFMLGATQLENGDRTGATVRSVMELLNSAYALHPAFGEATLLETGVDARPAFPDNLPRIRQVGGRIYVNGLFRHGYLLAPAMAEMLADHVLDGVTPELMDENTG